MCLPVDLEVQALMKRVLNYMPTGVYIRTKPVWNAGKKLPQFLEINNPNWKGIKAGYSAYHKWLQSNYGKADKCQSKLLELFCSNKSKKYHWAKLTNKKYEHKRENFIMLCASCHKRYDGTLPNKGNFKKGHIPWHKGKTKKDFPQIGGYKNFNN
jgi:hypothetical protein